MTSGPDCRLGARKPTSGIWPEKAC